ncbi:MAG: hypothetical protein ACE10C_00255 [Candidatus Binatia bacterium]
MDFISFLILLVISMVVSAIMHFGMNYYVTAGLSSYFSKVVIGWVGAYWGMRMLGAWWEGLNYGQVYFIPAILGSLALLIFMVDFVRTWRSAPRTV